MDNKKSSVGKVAYTASLLGTIKSHLAGLQGYDIMALELIQNADDAKAQDISFDVTDEGLFVRNSGAFTYCGHLDQMPCPWHESKNYSCDFHRILEVASGGKLSKSENIGRFGIGFVSTYQITDRPEIRSSGLALTLEPDGGSGTTRAFDIKKGTEFFLPWASDPTTKARVGLNVSHVKPESIDQLVKDVVSVLQRSLLFLRTLKTAEIRRNGELVLRCEISREGESFIRVKYSPEDRAEKWLIIRADAALESDVLKRKFQQLATLKRSTQVTVGIRVEPSLLSEGLLYAYLPTEQKSGLPLHINADFFPAPDRKSVIFAGHQHEQAWNEMLIAQTARAIAANVIHLRDQLGIDNLLGVAEAAWLLARSGNPPTCFKEYWARLHPSAVSSEIVPLSNGTLAIPGNALIPDKALTKQQVVVLTAIGVKTADESVRHRREVLGQLGMQSLTLDKVVPLLAMHAGQKQGEVAPVESVDAFYKPLWGLLNDLVPTQTSAGVALLAVTALKNIPCMLSEEGVVMSIDSGYAALALVGAKDASNVMTDRYILAESLRAYSKLMSLTEYLDINSLARELEDVDESGETALLSEIKRDRESLKKFYWFVARIDSVSTGTNDVYESIREIPMWLSGAHLVSADKALLPGNFNDPTGMADLLDVVAISGPARDFVERRLGVRTQTIESYIETVVPQLFGEDGPRDESIYRDLIKELAGHANVLDSAQLRAILAGLPIVPTQDGSWSMPGECYFYDDELSVVLGDAADRWVDVRRVPKGKSVENFLKTLGIRVKPTVRHLVDRLISAADSESPASEVRKSIAETFYALCERYIDQSKSSAEMVEAIKRLKAVRCFPADDDEENWYFTYQLYSPFQSEAFRSQVDVLAFPNRRRLNQEFMKALGFLTDPPTQIVIDHLLYCAESGEKPQETTYQILQQRALKNDPLLGQLRDEPCIYLDVQGSFIKPCNVYFMPQKLGRHAFTFPEKLGHYRKLFEQIGVKNEPDTDDILAIVFSLVDAHYEEMSALIDADRAVYFSCMSHLCEKYASGGLTDDQILQLSEHPSVLNIQGLLHYPEDILLLDSQWYADFFTGDLNAALCAAEPEWWDLHQAIGVKFLSEVTLIALDYSEGAGEEGELTRKIRDRAGVLLRVFHDKSAQTRRRLAAAFSQISISSYSVLRIKAEVAIGGHNTTSASGPAKAFYAVSADSLAIVRPIMSSVWSDAFLAILHQLMPSESGTDISRLVFTMRSLMEMTIEQANAQLTDSGIPELSELKQFDIDLTSAELGGIGAEGVGEDGEEDGDDGCVSGEPSLESERTRLDGEASGDAVRLAQGIISNSGAGSAIADLSAVDTGASAGASRLSAPRDATNPAPEVRTPVSGSGSGAGPQMIPNVANPNENSGNTGSRTDSEASVGGARSKPRAKHKKQMDERLLSYVRRAGDEKDSGDGSDRTEHNLAVEAAARVLVSEYERERGRNAVHMSQTHPGYDIESTDINTGEMRFIEVKGINGEWNRTGVGLSRTQFSNAQDVGDGYWLYVVEHVSDERNARIYAIRNPALRVGSFMFDENWRDAAEDEAADPSLSFVVGALIEVDDFGQGRLESITDRGYLKHVVINFGRNDRRSMALNLQTMRVLEVPDGNGTS